jgi:hypothetical protein
MTSLSWEKTPVDVGEHANAVPGTYGPTPEEPTEAWMSDLPNAFWALLGNRLLNLAERALH